MSSPSDDAVTDQIELPIATLMSEEQNQTSKNPKHFVLTNACVSAISFAVARRTLGDTHGMQSCGKHAVKIEPSAPCPVVRSPTMRPSFRR